MTKNLTPHEPLKSRFFVYRRGKASATEGRVLARPVSPKATDPEKRKRVASMGAAGALSYLSVKILKHMTLTTLAWRSRAPKLTSGCSEVCS